MQNDSSELSMNHLFESLEQPYEIDNITIDTWQMKKLRHALIG